MKNNEKTNSNRKENNSRNKTNSRGNRNYRSRDKGAEGNFSSRRSNGCTGNPHNDPSWYEPFSGSNELIAKLSFGTPLGAPNVLSPNRAFPGIMKLAFTSVPGISVEGDVESPISTAAQAFYTTIRYAQGVAGNYDPVDLMCYPLMGDSIYTMWAWMRRIYGTVNMYSVSNKYLAKALLEAMNVDYDDIRSNLYDYLGFINDYAYQMGALCMPSDFNAYKKHVRMVEHVFVDGTSAKAQMYVYNPTCVWKYDEFANEAYGALIPVPLDTADHLLTFQDIQDIANEIIYSVKHASTMMNMGGDIKRAYGDSGLMTVGLTELGYIAPIVYDPEQCMEIQNCSIVGLDDRNGSGSEYIKAMRGTNTIVYNPEFSIMIPTGVPTFFTHKYINLRDDAASPAHVVRATRNAAFVTTYDSNDVYHVVTCGTELINYIKVYGFIDEGEGFLLDDLMYTNSFVFINETTPTYLMELEKFDFHPYLYVVDGNTFIDIAGDVDNITTYDVEFLKKLNRYAILGEFKSPQMGTFFKP